MLKPFSLLPNLLFVTNHVVCDVAFLYFLNWYETGLWDGDGWIFIALGGVLCGTLALMIERGIYHRFELWPQSKLLFFTRLVTSSSLFVTMSFAISSLGIITDWPTSSSSPTIGMLVLIPLIAMFYLPMTVPFGVLLGVLNGGLLQLVHDSRMSGKSI